MANLLREAFFCSTVMGGMVVNLTSSDKGIVFSTGAAAAAFFGSFSAAFDVEADADDGADSESRGGVFSSDSVVASSDEAPPPKSPFSLPDK
jgi:hypothetical protein